MVLQRDIGLKSANYWGSSTLGIRTIFVELKDFSMVEFYLDSSITFKRSKQMTSQDF